VGEESSGSSPSRLAWCSRAPERVAQSTFQQDHKQEFLTILAASCHHQLLLLQQTKSCTARGGKQCHSSKKLEQSRTKSIASSLARPKPKSFYFCVEKKQDNQTNKQTNSALATFIIESILHSSSWRWENSNKTEPQNASRLKLFFASKYTHKNNNNASSSSSSS